MRFKEDNNPFTVNDMVVLKGDDWLLIFSVKSQRFDKLVNWRKRSTHKYAVENIFLNNLILSMYKKYLPLGFSSAQY